MNKLLAVKTALVIAATLATSLSAPAPAQAGLFGTPEVRKWDMCDWERIPDDAMARIMRRGDFDDILRRMFDGCPESALAFTDRPTATATEAEGDRGRSGTPDNGPTGDDDDQPDDEPEEQQEPEEPEEPEIDYGLPG